MKSMIGLIFTFLVLSVPAAYAQSAGEAEGTPFHISSRGSAYGVQGEFEGTYRVTDSAVEVYVRKGALYVSEHCPYQGRRKINYIKFGLWNQEASGWRVENSAPPLYLHVVMSPREEHPLSDLHFTLPKEAAPDLAKRWLVVEIQEETLDAPDRDGKKGYAFAHSCEDIFSKRGNDVAAQKKPCKTS
jgi:hypothetical protein